MESRTSTGPQLLNEIRDIVEECTDAITGTQFEHDFWVAKFPSGSCEITSVAVGRRLLDLGYGDADLVSYNSNNEDGYFAQSQNHVWLELHLPDGEFVSIDATAHQFPQLAATPVVVSGASPLRVAFKRQVWRRKISAPFEWHSDRFHAPILEHVASTLNAK